MKDNYVILRAPSAASSTRDILAGPGATPFGIEPAGQAMKVDIAELDRKDIRAITRDRDVVAVAPAMPMKLVEPLDTSPVAAPAAATVAWGVKAVRADTSPFTGNDAVVAVLDTGIDETHPAFAGVTLELKNFTSEADGDLHGHGTHCAGTIFGRNVDNTRIGIAQGVKRALIGKVLGADGGGSDQIVSAIMWAFENGANVISMSLGIDFPGFVKQMIDSGLPPELATTRALEGYRLNVLLFERIAALLKAGADFRQPTLIVAAAGNESQRNVNPDFEVAVSPPAVSNGVVSVAALGEVAPGFGVAVFSNTGANVSGPGVKIVSAKKGGGLVAMSGTSMATPHVAGVAALWTEKLKGSGHFNLLSLTSRLVAGCVTTGLNSGFDPFDVGEGMVQAPQS
jgi:subtilisin family serine protease